LWGGRAKEKRMNTNKSLPAGSTSCYCRIRDDKSVHLGRAATKGEKAVQGLTTLPLSVRGRQEKSAEARGSKMATQSQLGINLLVEWGGKERKTGRLPIGQYKSRENGGKKNSFQIRRCSVLDYVGVNLGNQTKKRREKKRKDQRPETSHEKNSVLRDGEKRKFQNVRNSRCTTDWPFLGGSQGGTKKGVYKQGDLGEKKNQPKQGFDGG